MLYNKYLYLLLLSIMFIGARPARVFFTKIPIKPHIIHDLTNYAGPAGDVSKPSGFFNFFGSIDPLNGGTTFPGGVDTIYGLPRKQYDSYYPSGLTNSMWWPGNRGLRLVFDMTGARDANDTLHKVTLTDLWGFNALFDAGDTLRFYNLDTIFRFPENQRSKFLARPDSLLTPFATLLTTVSPSGEWRSTTCNETCRYVMVRATRRNRGVYNTIADFSELSMYGTYNYTRSTLDTMPDNYNGPLQYASTYGSLAGADEGGGFDTAQQVYDGNWRIYGFLSYWDSTRTQTTTASATFTSDWFPDINVPQYKHYLRTGQRFWWSIKGPSQYLNSTHPGTPVNIDDFYADPEFTGNYTRDAKFFGWYANRWKDTILYVENGNEDDYTTPGVLCYYVRTSQDRDSMKVYNTTIKLIMSGTVEMDSCRIDALVWLSRILRADHAVPFDVINFHHYARTVNYLGYAPSTAQQVGGYGRSPEGDNNIGLAASYLAYAKACYNYLNGDTSILILNTEYGYGNYGTPSMDESQAAYPWDLGCTPSRGSLDSLKYKCLMMARSELIMCETPIVGYNEFFFRNTDGSSNNYPNLFLSYGRVALQNITPPYNATYFFPWWYYRASIYSRMKWYRLISATGTRDTTGLHHQYWQKVDSATGRLTDSTCDVVWKNSQQNATASNQTVVIGYRKNSTVEKYLPSFTSVVGTSSTQLVNLNSLFLTSQDEQPTFFFGKSGASLWLAPFKAIKKVN